MDFLPMRPIPALANEGFVLMTLDQKIVAAKGHGIFGWASLVKSIHTVNQFFKLSPGDAVILNDPSCGGLFPWAITCVLRTEHHILARSQKIKALWHLADKIDFESLRIPPTPLIQKGELQTQIFESLKNHPSVGPDFANTLTNITSLESFPMKNWSSLSPNLASRIRTLIHELPHREALQEVKLSTGEIIRLKLVCSDDGFSFDFGGTSVGQRCFLDEALILGICREYLLRFFSLGFQYGLFLDPWIHLRTPQQSCLQNKYPQGQLQGLARATGALLHVIQKCFQQIYQKDTLPFHNFYPLWIQVKNKNHFVQWILPPGSGALGKDSGISAFSVDGISEIPPIAEIQTFFEIEEFSLAEPKPHVSAQNSGQNLGQSNIQTQSLNQAGLGIKLGLLVKADCELLWFTERAKTALGGDSTHSSLEPCCVILNNEILPGTGQLHLRKGQSLRLQTGSGAHLT